MSSLEKPSYTPAEYLAIERAADRKSEYISGEMVAMSGVSRKHSLIKSQIEWLLRGQLEGRPCETHSSDLRVNVGTAYFYPDIVVVCGEPKMLDDTFLDTLLNPTVVIEVLSKSTENYDRGTKFMRYGQIESLQDYILVSQQSCRIEHFVRLGTGEWPRPMILTSFDDVLAIRSINCMLQVGDIYRGIDVTTVE